MRNPSQRPRRAWAISVALGCIVGAPGGAASSASAQCPPPAEIARLNATNSGTRGLFGCSIGLTHDTAVIGARNDNSAGPANAGAAYVFIRSGGSWTYQAQLFAPDAQQADRFGTAVAISGDTVIIGATDGGSTAGAGDPGAAYIFTRTGTTWSQQARLLSPDGENAIDFGVAVAIAGDVALIGDDLQPHTSLTTAGAVYVFTRTNGQWTHATTLLASDAGSGHRYGGAIAFDGQTAVIGARLNGNAGYTRAGAAYIYGRSGNVWTEQARLSALDAGPDDQFGTAVAVHGDSALIGAARDDHAGVSDAGSAYVFIRTGGTWLQQAQLSAADAAPADWFGTSVALHGDVALVGAPRHDSPATTDAGAAYAFTRSGTTWVRRPRLLASDALANDFLGRAVGLNADTALVGADGDDVLIDEAGSVYSFAFDFSTCTADTNCDGLIDFFDIDPFLLALFDTPAYAAAFPECNIFNANVNADQSLDLFDIDPFVACLFGDCP